MRDLSLSEVTFVYGGGVEPSPKGNNGWGNGADGINAGSGSGGSADSKTANGTTDGKPNSNPTTSSGR